MPKILTRLRIDEVSSVDRGAGEGVKVMLMKRRKKDKPMNAQIGKMFSKLFGGGNDNSSIIDKSLEGLAESVGTIVTEATNPAELSASLTKTFEQFGDHLKETLTAGPAVIEKEESNMDLSILKKALGLAETATEVDVTNAMAKQLSAANTTAEELKKVQKDLQIAKANFSTEELEFYNKVSQYDEEENDSDNMDTKEGKKAKKTFRLASKSERASIMKAAAPPVPENIRKILEDNEAMRKRIESLEGSGDLVTLNKRALEVGLSEAEGATIQKALKGDREAVEKLLGFVKQATAAAVAGGVFKEFGTSSGTGVVTSAYDELVAKAAELRKADPKMTSASAFAKAYEDPANADIVKRERGENRPNAA